MGLGVGLGVGLGHGCTGIETHRSPAIFGPWARSGPSSQLEGPPTAPQNLTKAKRLCDWWKDAVAQGCLCYLESFRLGQVGEVSLLCIFIIIFIFG